MKPGNDSFLKFEFEYRIFISLSIVLATCLISFLFFPDTDPLYRLIINEFLPGDVSSSAAYISASLIIVIISLLRMWAGSVLTSTVVMTFRVRTDLFSKEGPYQLVRNPIYLADWLAILVFALFLPPAGLMMPLLFNIHYLRLIRFEENSLSKEYKNEYTEYLDSVPRFLPNINSLLKFISEFGKFRINYDGFRHNALYVLFIPGFLAAAYWGNFIYAMVIGFAGVIDWAIIHTKIGVGKKNKASKVFKGVLYAQCWEDPEIDRAAFNITPEDVVFTITSGGCNALTFLIDNPEKIIALDLNPHQNYLLELKIAAMKRLCYDEVLQLFGIRNSNSRIFLYNDIRDLLSNGAREFWDKHLKEVKKGLIHSGRYEGYMRLLRRILIILIGKKSINRIFNSTTRFEREHIFSKKWNNRRWRIFTRVFLSRTMMSLLFTDDFFRYLDDKFSFGSNFADKVKKAVTELPLKENYFLTYILQGNYQQEFLPPYLKRDNYEKILSRLNRIEIVTESCEEYFKNLPDSFISKFNFTNIFEWLSPGQYENLLRETIRIAKNGAVITYRNLLVHREHPAVLDQQIHSCRALAGQLHHKDLSFIYDRYVVEKIIKKEDSCSTEQSKLIQEKNSENLSDFHSGYTVAIPAGCRR